MRRLETLLRVMRIALSGDLFHRETFEAIARVLDEEVRIGCLAVVVPEPTGKRLYAVSPGSEGVKLPPFGIVFPHAPENETVLTTGKSKIKNDTRVGDELDRIAVAWGFLSYALYPIRSGPDPKTAPIVGKLVVAFREAGAAESAPAELFEEIAAIFGTIFHRAVSLSRVRRLAMILETSSDAMLAWDADGRITDANTAASALSGVAHDELLGRSIGELFEALPKEAAPSTRLTMRRHDGELVPVSVTMTRVADDPLVASHALIRDESHLVAKEREAAQHLARIAELDKELRTILDNAPLVIFRIDTASGELAYLNLHAERLLGVPTEQALATRDFLRSIHLDADGMAAFDDAVACARAGAVSPAYEARLRGREGRPIAVRGTVYPLISERGDVIAVEGTLADVSVEQEIRQRLVQADRLSTLGTLAASVAHEINNPAAFMLLGLSALSRMIEDCKELEEASSKMSVRQMLAELRDATTRIVDIARDLRLFVSPGPGRSAQRLADPNEAVESALTLTRGRMMERANIVRRLEPVPPVRIDPGRLGQVIVNLLVNAAQALPRDRIDGRENVVTVTTRSAGEDVEIEVADTGIGIPEEHVRLIWLPFFTTKDPDAGSGLGLSITRDIVERAGGTVRVASDEHGTRFVVTLPAADGAKEPSPLPPVATAATAERRTVLVVEDEVTLARRLASELGHVHSVTVVHRGREALRLLLEQSFDVVLCDLRMPDLSGEALYATVRERDAAQARAFVFMTGVGFLPEVQDFFRETGRPVLEKPFSVERALEAIARVRAE